MSSSGPQTLNSSPLRRVFTRLGVSFLTGLVIACVSFLIVWFQVRDDFKISDDHQDAVWDLNTLSSLLQKHHARHGTFPETLDELDRINQVITTSRSLRKDRWHSPHQYRPRTGGYEVLSWGQDKAPGGVGLNADFSYDTDRGLSFEHSGTDRIPFQQFVTDDISTQVKLASGALGILSAAVTFVLLYGLNRRFSPRTSLIVSVAITLIGALAIASYMSLIFLPGRIG